MVDEAVTEEERQKAKEEAKKTAKKLEQKLSSPDAAWRYEATPSSVYDHMPSGWGEIFK